MDAAQRLLKTTALLPVVALLMAAPGWAQTLVAPPNVTIGNTGSASAFVTSSAAGTTEITYTSGTSYSTDNSGSGNWLVVTPSSLTTPASLSFSLRNNTTAGINSGASAMVTLTPTGPTGVSSTPVTISVNFDGGGSGGSTSLSASPNALSLTAGANSQASQSIAITTTSASALTISMTTSVTGSVNWLSTSTLATNTISSSGGTTLTVNAVSSNLATGNYQGTVTITPSTGLPLNITVNFTVGSTVGNGTWYATPGSVAWNFTTTSGSYPSQAVSISTTSGSATYSATTSANENNWLQVY